MNIASVYISAVFVREAHVDLLVVCLNTKLHLQHSVKLCTQQKAKVLQAASMKLFAHVTTTCQ